MCLDSFSSSNIIAFSSSLAIILGENLSADDIALLVAFFNSLADNLSIIATKKANENSDSES
jgi:hypothetical protein